MGIVGVGRVVWTLDPKGEERNDHLSIERNDGHVRCHSDVGPANFSVYLGQRITV